MKFEPDIAYQLARLERANKLGNELATNIQSWSKQNLSTTPVIAADRKGWSLRLDVSTPPPLDEWSLIFSDATNQLRSSLDNLIFSVLTPLPDSHTPKNTKLVKFPIATNAKDWKNAKLSVIHLPSVYRDRIEEWQPFKRLTKGGSLEEDGLVWLQHLSNSDKHQLQVIPILNTTEMSHSFQLEFLSFKEAEKSLPPKIEVLNSEFKDGEYLLKQNTVGRLNSIRGNYHVKARVRIFVEDEYYGITEVLANIWEYTALTIRHVMGIEEVEWRKWYQTLQ